MSEPPELWQVSREQGLEGHCTARVEVGCMCQNATVSNLILFQHQLHELKLGFKCENAGL